MQVTSFSIEGVRLTKQLHELNPNGLSTSQLTMQFQLDRRLHFQDKLQMPLACESSQSSIYAITFEELSAEQQEKGDNSKSIYTALKEGELDYNLQGKLLHRKQVF